MADEIATINRLIVKISRENEKALEELFLLTREKLFYLACKYLDDVSLAEDVLSVVFSKIYEKAKTFDKRQNGFNWLHAIVKNQALDFNKREKKYENTEFNEEFYISDVSNNSSRITDVKIALKYLNETESKIIRYKFWENNTLKEISDKLSVPVSTLHRMYVQTLKKLHKVLSEIERGDNYEDK